MKTTVVLGATPNPNRYAHAAVVQLQSKGHEVLPIGIRRGQIDGTPILLEKPVLDHKEVDTITLYLNPKRQEAYYEYILSIHPKRIIFNPGTENPELYKLAEENGIEVEIACTLVMLATGSY